MGVLDRRRAIACHQRKLQGPLSHFQRSKTISRRLQTSLLDPVDSSSCSSRRVLRPSERYIAGQFLQKASIYWSSKYWINYKDSTALFGGFTLYWLNLSPFYLKKETEQINTLKTLWKKLGTNMKVYNDMVSKFTTSTNIDKDTWKLYASRNSSSTGLCCPE